MDLSKYKKDDFFMTGSAQSALIYIYIAAMGAKLANDNNALLFFENGVVTLYFSKIAITELKNEVLAMGLDEFQDKYQVWLRKWEKYNNEFYQLATDMGKNWRGNWHRLNQIAKEFWTESYFVDSVDHFAEDFDQVITRELVNKKFDPELRSDLILPAQPTKVQQVSVDLMKVKNGSLSKEDFLRQYWYSHGSWNGGALLTSEKLARDLESIEEESDFSKRKKVQEEIDPKLSDDVLKLVRQLRVFALWRDERKAFLQMMNLGFVRIAEQAARELNVDKEVIEFSLASEMDEIAANPQKFLARKEKSVVIWDKGKGDGIILTGVLAEPLIKEFMEVAETKELKGIIASPGKVIGKAQVILRRHQFFEFEEGDILITAMTRPEFVPLMKKASAIITDEGGLTCHAAIVSRELKKPCIVGTKEATRVLKTGDRIEVDANNGIIKKL